ncbi:MAG: AsmA family protein [Candidatus Omnitrophota bacterium]
MKVFKIILISFLSLIVVLCAALVIVIKTFNVNKYKPQIIEQARTLLDREIDFDKADLGISFTRGISLNISDLAIGENPSFARGDFLRIKHLSFSVDVLGYIFQKKINVPNILIDSPRVIIIRQKSGAINAASFGKPEATGDAVVQDPGPAPEPLVSPAILVSSFKIGNGAVTYVDNSFEPPVSIDVTDMSVEVNKISLTEPFAFSVEAAVLSARKNIKLAGKAQIDLSANEISVSDFTAVTELSDLIMANIPAAFPMTKGVVLPQSLKGRVDVTLDTLTAGPKGLGALKADMTLSDGAVQFKEILSPVKDIGMHVKLTQSDIIMDKGALVIGEGRVTCSGSLRDYLAAQGYSMQADITNLKIQDLVARDKAPVQVEGIVSGPVKVNGAGFTPEALQSSLSGAADISLVKTKLKGLNVLRIVLDKISVIPGLSQTIEASLPEKFKQKLQQKDTSFSDIKMPLVIEDGRIRIKDTVIASEDFIFRGTADAGFDASYSLEGAFLFSRELSDVMAGSVSQLKYLLNGERQIYIPLKVSGMAANVTFSVDADYIGKKLLENQAKQQIFKALDKVLGTSQPHEGESQNSAPQGSGDNSAVKESVSSILDNIFKK